MALTAGIGSDHVDLGMDTRIRLVFYRFVHSYSFHFLLFSLSYSPSLIFSFHFLSYTLP
jgi:hypothetical protein